jgi:hypothetical protein
MSTVNLGLNIIRRSSEFFSKEHDQIIDHLVANEHEKAADVAFGVCHKMFYEWPRNEVATVYQMGVYLSETMKIAQKVLESA